MRASRLGIRRGLVVALCLLVPSCTAVDGQFVRSFCYSGRGNRFRVNSPDTARGRYKDRWEAKQSGEMRLKVDEDLSRVRRSELYLELWGGHPGVANKRFTINGRSRYVLPEVGAADKNCTYSYPTVALKIDDLVRGTNRIQFTCHRGKTFWGHYLIRAACIRLVLNRGHPVLKNAGLGSFTAQVVARPEANETIHLKLEYPEQARGRIRSVQFWGRYRGYDENGDGNDEDWHGFTKDLKPVGIIAAVNMPPFETVWDLSMIPEFSNLVVRAIVRFKDAPDVVYITRPTEGLRTPVRNARVRLLYSDNLPRPFWSRAGRASSCTIMLDDDPSRIERAQLHVNVWDGGKGSVKKPLSLNKHELETKDWQGRHDLIYTVIELDVSMLRAGANRVRVLSDTDHHGIEVCLPGPALIVRSRGRESERGQSR